MAASRAFLTSFLVLIILTSSAAAQELRLENFFAGRTTATGSFETITGFKRNFDVVLHGRWNGKTLTLREDFAYDDGERDTKTWRFTRTGPSTYSGTRDDVIGTAIVRLVNNKAYFSYDVDLEPGSSRNVVRFFDKLVLSENGRTVVNTARIFKGPIPVGRVRVDFKR